MLANGVSFNKTVSAWVEEDIIETVADSPPNIRTSLVALFR